MLKRMVRIGVVVGWVVAVGLGCDPVTPAPSPADRMALEHGQTQTSLVQNLYQTLTHFNDQFAFLDDTELKDVTAGAFEDHEACVPSSNGTGADCASAGVVSGTDVTRLRDEAIEFLQQRVLLASQLEGGVVSKQLVYRLDPGLQCDDEEECVQFLTEQPIRVSVTSSEAQAYDVSLMVGDDKIVPVRFRMTPKELSVTLYLAQSGQVLNRINTYLGDDALPTLSEAEGVVRAKISYISDNESQLALDVLESVYVSIPVDEQALTLTMGAGEVVAVANSLAETLGALVFLGATNVSAPGAWLDGLFADDNCVSNEPFEACVHNTKESTFSGVFELALSGVTAQSLLKAGDRSISLTGLGLGSDTSTLSYNGVPLASVDINPDDGRTFDMTLALSQPHEFLQIVVGPRLDAWLQLSFAPLLKELDSIPAWMLDDELNLVFEGAQSAMAELRNDWLSIVSGDLVLSSSTSAAGALHVSEGMCLGMKTPDAETDDSLLQSMQVEQCGPVKASF